MFSLDAIDYKVAWLEHAASIGLSVDFIGLYNERYCKLPIPPVTPSLDC